MCARDDRLTLSSAFRPLILAGLAACWVSACCAPRPESKVLEVEALLPFEQFREAARFSLPATESWWFVMWPDETAVGDGPIRVLLCGSDFREPDAGFHYNTYTAVCILDYEGRTLPRGAVIDRLTIPHSIGAASWFGMSLFEAAGNHEVFAHRGVVDNRFVVAANSKEALSQALKGRGKLMPLDGSALSRLPHSSPEVVFRSVRMGATQREVGMACLPKSRSVLLFSSDYRIGSGKVQWEPISLESGSSDGQMLPGGWIEYLFPKEGSEEGDAVTLGFYMLLAWGAYVVI